MFALRTAAALSLFAATITACDRSPYHPAPETRTAVVTDTLHGVTFEDPYRWLEDQNAPEVRDWIAVQTAHADSVLGPDNPLRQSLRTRLTALMDAPSPGNPRRAGDYEYFTLRRVGEPVAAIYRRKTPKGDVPVSPDSTYEKVIDPLELRNDGTTSVNIESFSRNNRLMMYTVRDGGSDEISVRFRDLSSGTDVPDSLPNALYSSLSFGPDGEGVYFVHRSRSVGPRFKYHRLGTDRESDSTLFGEGIPPTAFINVSQLDGGRYRVFSIGHGWARNEILVEHTRTGQITDITKGLDAHFSSPQYVDGKLWVRTDYQAPRGRLVAIDLAKPAPDQWREIIPQGDHVLDGYTQIEGRIYATWIHDVSNRITVHDKSGKQVGDIAVPPFTNANIRGAGRGKASLTLSSFDRPSVTWEINLANGERTLSEPPRITFDTSNVTVTQVWYTSTDGTRAPMYLLHRRDMVKNGNTPVLLSGYGGFAVSLMPNFNPRAAAWVERGGIYAQATLRGGNEYGEEWHRAGMLQNKQHVFDDFLSAAQFLVDSGYTNPQRLTIRGGSNGGLLMGSAITQRPELFRAAFVGVPDLDMVRFYTFTTHNNMPALLEYGDASKPEEFEAIRKYSPYQNVRSGVKYPAVMVQTGLNDTRVPPWQARKFTARLQASTKSGLPVVLYHDLRSGHAGGRGMEANIDLATRELEFLLRMVGDTVVAP